MDARAKTMEMLKRLAKALLPEQFLRALRGFRRRRRHTAWEDRVREDPDARVTQSALVEQFRRLGVRAGQDLLVHSSLSSLGMVEGGAETVVKALLEVVGPDANLLMPVYPMHKSMHDTMLDSTPFDVIATPSHMGKITEVFRCRASVRRSGHPTHSVAVEGPHATEYVARHHKSRSPCGPGSPFQLLVERGGAILCLGTGVGKVTSHHVIEDLVERFPIPVYLTATISKVVRFEDGVTETVEVLVHDPRLAGVRIDNHAQKEREILEQMRERKIVKEGKVGLAHAHLFGAAELNQMLGDLLDRGITIYASG